MRDSERHERWKALAMEEQKGICPWCAQLMLPGEKTNREHVRPRAHGGTSARYNTVLMHERCNEEKAHRCPGCSWCVPENLARRAREVVVAFRAGKLPKGGWRKRCRDWSYVVMPEAREHLQTARKRRAAQQRDVYAVRHGWAEEFGRHAI